MRITAEKINWRFALGELTLIVIGILMALAIDSYAGRRAEAAQADVYIRDLITELQADAAHIEDSYSRVGHLIDSASSLLSLLEGKGEQSDDPGGLLLGSLFGEAIMRQPAIWEEIQMTGALRLIPDPKIRAAIVSHYLARANIFKIIDENFVPAVRDLRALAWDVMPIESFARYMKARQSGGPQHSGVDKMTVMSRLLLRNDTIFLLKRCVLTATVARLNLKRASENAASLLTELGVPSEPDIK